ncbi:hypothetical protein Q8F55_006018 [Vanrija albida]|uniref:Deacetylase sirtuin-type domain-containing protein n=1 Tax=Vanrija albida TaxID=181172 RepID=A0ABR3Q491_9TREE
MTQTLPDPTPATLSTLAGLGLPKLPPLEPTRRDASSWTALKPKPRQRILFTHVGAPRAALSSKLRGALATPALAAALAPAGPVAALGALAPVRARLAANADLPSAGRLGASSLILAALFDPLNAALWASEVAGKENTARGWRVAPAHQLHDVELLLRGRAVVLYKHESSASLPTEVLAGLAPHVAKLVLGDSGAWCPQCMETVDFGIDIGTFCDECGTEEGAVYRDLTEEIWAIFQRSPTSRYLLLSNDDAAILVRRAGESKFSITSAIPAGKTNADRLATAPLTAGIAPLVLALSVLDEDEYAGGWTGARIPPKLEVSSVDEVVVNGTH